MITLPHAETPKIIEESLKELGYDDAKLQRATQNFKKLFESEPTKKEEFNESLLQQLILFILFQSISDYKKSKDTINKLLSYIKEDDLKAVAGYINLACLSKDNSSKKRNDNVTKALDDFSINTESIRKFPVHLKKEDFSAIKNAIVDAGCSEKDAAHKVLQFIDSTVEFDKDDHFISEKDKPAFEYALELFETIGYKSPLEKSILISRDFLLSLVNSTDDKQSIIDKILKNKSLVNSLIVGDLKYLATFAPKSVLKYLIKRKEENIPLQPYNELPENLYNLLSKPDENTLVSYLELFKHFGPDLAKEDIHILNPVAIESSINDVYVFHAAVLSFKEAFSAYDCFRILSYLFSEEGLNMPSNIEGIENNELLTHLNTFLQIALECNPFKKDESADEDRKTYLEEWKECVQTIVSSKNGQTVLLDFFSEKNEVLKNIGSNFTNELYRVVFDVLKENGKNEEVHRLQLILFDNPQLKFEKIFGEEKRLKIAISCADAAQKEKTKSGDFLNDLRKINKNLKEQEKELDKSREQLIEYLNKLEQKDLHKKDDKALLSLAKSTRESLLELYGREGLPEDIKKPLIQSNINSLKLENSLRTVKRLNEKKNELESGALPKKRYENILLNIVFGLLDSETITEKKWNEFFEEWLKRNPSVYSLVQFLHLESREPSEEKRKGLQEQKRKKRNQKFSAVRDRVAVYIVKHADEESSELDAFLYAMIPDRLDLIAEILKDSSAAIRKVVAQRFLEVFLGRDVSCFFGSVKTPRDLAVGDVESASFSISDMLAELDTAELAKNLLESKLQVELPNLEKQQQKTNMLSKLLTSVFFKSEKTKDLFKQVSSKNVQDILKRNAQFLIMVMLSEKGHLQKLIAAEDSNSKKEEISNPFDSEETNTSPLSDFTLDSNTLTNLLDRLGKDFYFVLVDYWLSQEETKEHPDIQKFLRNLIDSRLQPMKTRDRNIVSQFSEDIGVVNPSEQPIKEIFSHVDALQLANLELIYKESKDELKQKFEKVSKDDKIKVSKHIVEIALRSESETFAQTLVEMSLPHLTFGDFHNYLEKYNEWNLKHLDSFIQLFLEKKCDAFYSHLKSEDASRILYLHLSNKVSLNDALVARVAGRLPENKLESFLSDSTISTDNLKRLIEVLLDQDKLEYSTRYFLLQWVATAGVVCGDQIKEVSIERKSGFSERLKKLNKNTEEVCESLPSFVFSCGKKEENNSNPFVDGNAIAPAVRYISLIKNIKELSDSLDESLSKHLPVDGKFPQCEKKGDVLNDLEKKVSELHDLVYKNQDQNKDDTTSLKTPKSFCESLSLDPTIKLEHEMSAPQINEYAKQTSEAFVEMFGSSRQEKLVEIIDNYFKRLEKDKKRARAFLEGIFGWQKFFEGLKGNKNFPDILSDFDTKNKPKKGWSSSDLFGIAVLKLLKETDCEDRRLLLSAFSKIQNEDFKNMLVRRAVEWMEHSKNTDPFLEDKEFVSFLLDTHYKERDIESLDGYVLFLQALRSAGNLKNPNINLGEVIKKAKFNNLEEEMRTKTYLWILYNPDKFRVTDKELESIVKNIKQKRLQKVLGQKADITEVLYDVFMLRSRKESLNDSYFLGDLIRNKVIESKTLIKWAKSGNTSRYFFITSGLNAGNYEQVLKDFPEVAFIPNLHLTTFSDQFKLNEKILSHFITEKNKLGKFEQRWKIMIQKKVTDRRDLKDPGLRKLQRRIRRRSRGLLEEIARKDGMKKAIATFLEEYYMPWLDGKDMGLAVGVMPLEAAVFFSWMRRADRYAQENVDGFKNKDVCREGEKSLMSHGRLFLRLRSRLGSIFADRRIRKNPFKEEPPFYDSEKFFENYSKLKEIRFNGNLLVDDLTRQDIHDNTKPPSDNIVDNVRKNQSKVGSNDSTWKYEVRKVLDALGENSTGNGKKDGKATTYSSLNNLLENETNETNETNKLNAPERTCTQLRAPANSESPNDRTTTSIELSNTNRNESPSDFEHPSP